MSNLAYWSMIVAFFIPIVVSVVTQSNWASKAKAIVFFVVSVVAAAGTAYFQGDLTGRNFVESALLILAAATSFYKGIFKPTGLAERIESATDVSG